MMRKISLFLFLSVIAWAAVWGRARALPMPLWHDGDSIEVSVLTCGPGPEVYSYYGHTAIRFAGFGRGEDIVFNYGVFSFRKPHFVWNFVRGRCDYRIAALPFEAFMEDYVERGSWVYAQVLNLTAEEKRRLWDLLTDNLRPENCEYRYSYLYDNCTTRARDMIERATNGKVIYPPRDTVHTFRQILHRYSCVNPWAMEGNDICLGVEVDVPLTVRNEMFVPDFYRKYLDGAVVRHADCADRQLVSDRYMLHSGSGVFVESWCPISPLSAGVLAVLFTVVLTLVELRRGMGAFWIIDAVLMTLVGLMGVVVAFLVFFSDHPAVDVNWQLWVFNPLPLLCMPYVCRWAAVGRQTKYHVLCLIGLVCFAISSLFNGQDYCSLVIPLALCLFCRSFAYVMSYARRKDGKANKRK